MSDEPQIPLFEKGEWWDDAWKGMPEFVQKDLSPVKTIYVHFAKREDMENFSKLVGQTLTMKTQSIWYPEAEIGRISNKRFVDAPELSDDVEVLDEDESDLSDIYHLERQMGIADDR